MYATGSHPSEQVLLCAESLPAAEKQVSALGESPCLQSAQLEGSRPSRLASSLKLKLNLCEELRQL